MPLFSAKRFRPALLAAFSPGPQAATNPNSLPVFVDRRQAAHEYAQNRANHAIHSPAGTLPHLPMALNGEARAIGGCESASQLFMRRAMYASMQARFVCMASRNSLPWIVFGWERLRMSMPNTLFPFGACRPKAIGCIVSFAAE